LEPAPANRLRGARPHLSRSCARLPYNTKRARGALSCHYLSFSEPFDIFIISVLRGQRCGTGRCWHRKQQAGRNLHGVSFPFSWPTLPAGSTGTLKCAPRPPPNKVNQLLSGPLTAPPRPANGHPKGKGRGGVKGARRGGPE